MKGKNYLPVLLAFATVGVLVAYFPPGQFSWHRFYTDPSSLASKAGYLFKVYAMPASLSFAAVLLFQIQMRMSMYGAPVSVIFPLAVLGSSSMMGALRTMVGGIGGVPGYALGMAAAYTVMSRFYAVRPSGRFLFGRPMLRIVWRGEAEAMKRQSAVQ